MQMTEKEIIRSYKEAKSKQEQIKILADLNTCKKEDIRKILREAGLDVPSTGNRYTKKKEDPEDPGKTMFGGSLETKKTEKTEASGSKRKRLLKNEEQTDGSDLSIREDPDKLEAKKAETNCSECEGGERCGSAKPDGIYCSGFKPKKKKSVPVPPEVIEAAKIWLRSYEEDIEELEQKKKAIDEELEDIRETTERIRSWLAIEEEIQGKVTCSSCRHLAQEEMQGQAAPVSICRDKYWKQVGKAPHVIQHDTEKPIFCNHWEGGEEI